MAYPFAHANFLNPQFDHSLQSSRKQLWISALLCLLLLSFEIYLLLHDFGDSLERVSSSPVLARYEKGLRDVRFKPAGTLAWNTPHDQEALYVQDSILTLQDSRALVVFLDDTEIQIEPNSLVVLEKVAEAGDHRVTARIVRGAVVHTKQGRKKLTVKYKEKEEPLGIGERASVEEEQQKLILSKPTESTLRWQEPPATVSVQKPAPAAPVQEAPMQEAPKKKKAARSHNASPLQAPKLHKPKIKIQPHGINKPLPAYLMFADWVWNGVIPDAEAREKNTTKTREVLVQLEWEPLPQAKKYLLQISLSKKFKKKVLEEKITTSKFDYRTFQSDKKRLLYFRVAAIDSADKTGEFSVAQILEIAPISTPIVAVEKNETPASQPTMELAKKNIAPIETLPPEKVSWKVFSDVGISYHHRDFKNSEKPKSVTASGFVPAALQIETRAFHLFRFADLSLGFFGIAEQAEPETINIEKESKAMPLLRLWANLTWDWNMHTFGAGLALSNTYELGLSGRNFTTKMKLLAGPSIDFIHNAKKTKQIYFRVLGAVYAATSPGIDLNPSVRVLLPKSEPYNWFQYRGPFAELNILGRFLVSEISYGAVAKVGYAF